MAEHNGDWIKVKDAAFGAGATSFTARVASATSGGRIELHLDSLNGTLIGPAPSPAPAAGKPGQTVTRSVNRPTGTHDLFFRFTGGSGFLFNINWWQFNTGR